MTAHFGALRLLAAAHSQRGVRSGRSPVTPIALSAIALALPMAAWPDDALPPVVVTATRAPIALDKVTADVVLIDADRIAASSADTVEDLLRQEAGLNVVRNGGPGQNASVFIRGASGANTLVLVDGVRIGSATLGQVEFEGLGLAQIDHIEVLRGPAASLYGADAVGGVIQIFTRRGTGAPRTTARLAFGGEASRDAAMSVAGATSLLDYAVSLSQDRSAGVSAIRPGDRYGLHNPDRDGYTRNAGQLRVGLTPQPGQHLYASLLETRLDARYDDASYPPPDYAADPSPDFHNHLRTSVASVGYDGTLAPGWTGHVQLARNEDDQRSITNAAGTSSTDRFYTRRDSANAQVAWAAADGVQLVGAVERILESAEAMSFLANPDRSNDAVVLGASVDRWGQQISLDVRRDDNSVYGSNTTGRAGWAMPLGAGFRVRALAGTTFRAPTFNDLYYIDYGVPTIRPEHGRSIEAGLEWRAGDSAVQATVYRNQVHDLIAYESDPGRCPADPAYDYGCAANVGRARLQGVTIGGSQRLGNLALRANIDLVDAKDTATGQRLARRASRQETLGADYTWRDWTGGATLVDVGARPDGGERLGGYATLDLQARWHWSPRWQLETKLTNATDRDIQPLRDYRAPGRVAWIGVRYDSGGP